MVPLATASNNMNVSYDSAGQSTASLPLFLVPDLEAVILTDEHSRIFTRHFEVPSIPAITRAQQELVHEQVEAFRAANVTDVGPGKIQFTELNMRSELTAASTGAIGIRVATYESTDSGRSTRSLTQWYDHNGSDVRGTRDLFGSHEDWAQFKEFVAQAATTDPRIFVGELLDLDDSWLDSVNFDLQGNALVEFNDGQIDATADEPIIIKISVRNLAGLLSDFGTLARAASTSPSPRIQLGMLQDAGSRNPPVSTNAEPALPTAAGSEAKRGPAPDEASPRIPVDCTVAKCVALTFDDGPGPKTDKLLDTLKDGNAPSTFFVTGPNAQLRPELLVRMAAEGHEVGNHTWNHRSLVSMSSAQIRREIERTNAAITAAIEQPATLLRPPYGSHDSTSDQLASTPVILWDVDTLDWKHRDTEKVINTAVAQTSPGSIVLMHDIQSSTVAAVPRILSGLRSKGYTFVTVSELLAPSGLEAGASYSHGPRPSKPSPASRGEVRYP